jgi:membrane fusion protein (multidrug efflux system)
MENVIKAQHQYINSVKWLNVVKYLLIPASLAALFLSSCSSNQPPQAAPPPPSLPVAAVITGTDTTYQDYPASVEGVVNVEIRPQISGPLEKVFVDEGAYVDAGQPLFKINDLPFKAQYNNALASLHAAEAAVVNAQLEVEKLIPLVQNKVVSDFQLKTAKASLDVAKANAEQAKATVSTAEINLGYTLIKAPVSGYIGRLLKKQGSLVSSTDADALTLLSDVRNVHVYFSLGEKDFADFKSQYPGSTLSDKLKGMAPVTLLLADQSAYNQRGNVDMIDGQFDKNTGAITLRASFPNAQGLLRSGNTGKVRLSLLHKDALIIPQSATIEMQDKTFVFAVGDSDKVKRLPIVVEGKSGSNYIVKEGVKRGDQIVLSGIDHLQEGEVIHPQKPSEKMAAN